GSAAASVGAGAGAAGGGTGVAGPFSSASIRSDSVCSSVFAVCPQPSAWRYGSESINTPAPNSSSQASMAAMPQRMCQPLARQGPEEAAPGVGCAGEVAGVLMGDGVLGCAGGWRVAGRGREGL